MCLYDDDDIGSRLIYIYRYPRGVDLYIIIQSHVQPRRVRVRAHSHACMCQHPCVCAHTKHDAIICNNYLQLAFHTPTSTPIDNEYQRANVLVKLLEYLSMINSFPEYASHPTAVSIMKPRAYISANASHTSVIYIYYSVSRRDFSFFFSDLN